VKNCVIEAKQSDTKINGVSDCLKGKKFHSFVLKDVKGKFFSSIHEKNLILINYWFIGCQPCEKEKHFLKELAKEFSKLKIVSVSLDDKEDILRYAKKNKLPNWTFIPDYKNQLLFENEFGYPLSIIIKPNGTILKFIVGGIINEKKFDEVVTLLKSIQL
jgi:peroxiredoxin